MKMHNPSAVRNRDEILEVLTQVLPETGLVLEIASGCGQHCTHFVPHFPGLIWQPTDRDPAKIASIRAYAEEVKLSNLRAPIKLDTTWDSWPIKQADAMVNINMIHASAWESCLGLLKGAARTLVPGAPLFLYGAYIRHDRETAPSNIEFDKRLRARDPSWGVRQFETVVESGENAGLKFDRILDVPNNNYGLVFRKAETP